MCKLIYMEYRSELKLTIENSKTMFELIVNFGKWLSEMWILYCICYIHITHNLWLHLIALSLIYCTGVG